VPILLHSKEKINLNQFRQDDLEQMKKTQTANQQRKLRVTTPSFHCINYAERNYKMRTNKKINH
jgi:hypothetical protein